jgi:hypothetical protein
VIHYLKHTRGQTGIVDLQDFIIKGEGNEFAGCVRSDVCKDELRVTNSGDNCCGGTLN